MDALGDPRYQRTGAIVLTPNGYLVKYRGAGDAVHVAVSSTEASMYMPHRAISPAMSREAFLDSLTALSVGGEAD